MFYIGFTNDLVRRVLEHRTGDIPGFTQKYNLKKLVHFEHTTSAESAIIREKQLKGWTRQKKLALIIQTNPLLDDLFETIL